MQSRMNNYKLFVATLFVILMVQLVSCGKKISHKGKVVFTQVPYSEVKSQNLNTIENKYAPAMKIALAKRGEQLENIEVLTQDFNSARSPEISYNAEIMVFSAQKEEKGIWQIWSMNLETKEMMQVTDSRTNCTDPAWLPNGDIVFSKLITGEKALKYHALFTIGADGCCEQRITFQPHEDVNTSVLHDGRILVSSKQVYPQDGPLKYLALRPDGTKAEVFHLADPSSEQLGKATEVGNGKVLFAESAIMTSVNFSRPLHSEEVVLNQDHGKINSISLIDDEILLISIRKPNELTYGIAIVKGSNPAEASFYYNDSDYHMMEAVMVKEKKTPKKLPSRVNGDMNTGFFFSMNTNASDIKAEGITAKVQVLGMNDILGETAVAEDGSFYLELTADRPVRFQTVDEKGEILRGPSSWMWVRPNERRGCTGCHQDREIAPNNVVPKAMEKAPFAMIR